MGVGVPLRGGKGHLAGLKHRSSGAITASLEVRGGGSELRAPRSVQRARGQRTPLPLPLPHTFSLWHAMSHHSIVAGEEKGRGKEGRPHGREVVSDARWLLLFPLPFPRFVLPVLPTLLLLSLDVWHGSQQQRPQFASVARVREAERPAGLRHGGVAVRVAEGEGEGVPLGGEVVAVARGGVVVGGVGALGRGSGHARDAGALRDREAGGEGDEGWGTKTEGGWEGCIARERRGDWRSERH